MITRKLKIGSTFEVRYSKKLVDVETTDKQWKVQFGAKTKEYAQIIYLIAHKCEQELVNLVHLLFFTRNIVGDTYFLKLYQSLMQAYFIADKDAVKGIQKQFTELMKEHVKEMSKPVSEEEQREILEQEEVMHNGK